MARKIRRKNGSENKIKQNNRDHGNGLNPFGKP
jgi:hypothetical protein